jgi:hypothetical protein
MSTNFKSLLTTPSSNVLPLHLKQTFPPIIWIFTEREGDGIESRLPFKMFSTLLFSLYTYLKMLSYFVPFPHKKFCLCCVVPRRPRDAKCIHSCSVLMFLVECGIEWRAGKENHWHEKELILRLFLLFRIFSLVLTSFL